MTKWIPSRRSVAVAAAATAAVCAVAAAAGLVYAAAWLSAPGLDKRAARLVGETAGGEASFDVLTASLSDGVFLAEGFRLVLPGGVDATVEKIELEIDYSSLWFGRLTVNRLTVTRPTIRLASPPPPVEGVSAVVDDVDSGGARLAPPRITLPLLRLTLRDLRVDGLRVESDAFDLNDIQLAVSGRIDSAGPAFSASVATGPDGGLALRTGSLTMEAATDVIVTFNLETSGRFSLAAKGGLSPRAVKGASAPARRFSVSLTAGGDLYTPQFEASALADLDGERFFEGSAGAQAVGPKIDFNAGVDRLRLDLARLAAAAGVTGVTVEGALLSEALTLTGDAWRNGLRPPTARITGGASIDLVKLAVGGIALPKGGRVGFTLNPVVYDGTRFTGGIGAEGNIPRIERAGTTLDGVVLSASATAPGEGAATFAGSVAAVGGMKGSMPIPALSATAEGEGDPLAGRFDRFVATVVFPNNNSEIRVAGEGADFGRDSFDLTVGATIDAGEWGDLLTAIGAPVTVGKGEITAAATAAGKMGDAFISPRFSFFVGADAHRLGLKTGENIGVGSGDIDVTLSGKINPLWQVTDLLVESDLIGRSVTMGPAGAMGKVTGRVKLASPQPVYDKVSLDIAATLDGINTAAATPPARATVRLVGVTDPVTRRHQVDEALLDLGVAGRLAFSGVFDNERKVAKGAVTAEKLDLGVVAALAPPGLLPVVGVTGILDLKAEATSREDVEKMAAWYPFPGAASVRLSVKNGGGKVPGAGEATEAEVDLTLAADGAKGTAEGFFRIGRVVAEGVFDGTPFDPSLDIALRIDGDRLTLSRLVLDVPAVGVTQGVEGKASGVALERWQAEGFPSPARLAQSLSGVFTNYTAITLDNRRPLVADMAAEGEVVVDATVTADKGRGISVEGRLTTDRLSVAKGENISVEKVSGVFPFAKSLRYVFGPSEGKGEASVVTVEADRVAGGVGLRDRSFFTDIHVAAPDRDNFTVDRIVVGPVSLAETAFDMTFRQSRFGLDYFRARLADGGGIAGAAQVAGAGGVYTVKANQVFTGVDVARLVGRGEGDDPGETLVDGSFTMEAKLAADEKAETLDLSRIDLSFHLTRIGGKTLDRLLRFIDPEEKSPAVMNARTALRFASPSTVDVEARHGALSVMVDLRYAPLLGGRTVTLPVVKKAPIQGLVNFAAIRSALRQASAARPVIRIVGAEVIRFDETGGGSLR